MEWLTSSFNRAVTAGALALTIVSAIAVAVPARPAAKISPVKAVRES
jgi:hypothetical protein